jgi:hypothetical protein
MESGIVCRVYRFRLEPTAAQEQRFRQFAGARRFIWNWALQQRRAHYRQTGTTLPAKELSARLTALKAQPETAWLREMDSQLLQQVLADLERAFVNFFERRARYPRFKSRKRDQARFRIPQRVRVVGDRVQVPKIGYVRLRLSRPVEGQTKSATFKQDACGHWYVSLVAQTQMPLRLVPRLRRHRAWDWTWALRTPWYRALGHGYRHRASIGVPSASCAGPNAPITVGRRGAATGLEPALTSHGSTSVWPTSVPTSRTS